MDRLMTLASCIAPQMDFLLLGLYGWEVATSCWFEWEVITGKRPFRWPMIVYWIAKYWWVTTESTFDSPSLTNTLLRSGSLLVFVVTM